MKITRTLALTTALLFHAAPALLIAGACTTRAVAQIKDSAPSYMVVDADKTPAHCKDSTSYYKVAELAKGQVLFVDGESDTWARVGYPPELTAFVRVEDVTIEGDTAKLVQPSRLKAANATAGWAASWQLLTTAPLPVGTVLKKKEDIRETADGPVVGYRVFAPSQARMFVQTKNLRKATDAESAAYRAKAGTPAPVAPAPVTPAPAETPKPADTSKPTEPAKPVDLTQPQVTKPGTGDATKPLEPAPTTLNQGEKNDSIIAPTKPADATKPGPAQPQGGETAKPQESVPTVRPSQGPTEFERQAALAESLESKLRAIATQPVLTAEVDELMGEFEKAVASETSDRRRQALAGRLEYLRLRREFRDTVRRQEEARAALDTTNQAVTQALADVAKSRVYTVVGELQPSTVYDGRQLPLMFRVVSIGTSAPKTLGYVKPSQEWDLERMLGLVVGVIGDADIDRSLKLNVITPVRVEVLTAGAQGQPFRIDAAPRMEDRPAQPEATPAPEAGDPADVNK